MDAIHTRETWIHLQEDYGRLCSLDKDSHCMEHEPDHLRVLQSQALGAHHTSLRSGLLPKVRIVVVVGSTGRLNGIARDRAKEHSATTPAATRHVCMCILYTHKA